MVSPSSSCNQPCRSVSNGTTIDQALGNITSGSYLQLLPGCHCIQKFNVVGDVSDVSLIGVIGEVQITCAPGLGLAFLNVTRLSLQGLTITGCGLNGSNAVALNSAINTLVELFIQLTEDSTIAVIIASCMDVAMDHVTIVNTTGLGLIGINVVGQSNFTNNVFSFNVDQQCPVKSSNVLQSPTAMVGGGAQFIYVDFIDRGNSDSVYLNIDNSTFSYNSYCGSEITLEIYNKLIDTLRNRNYTIGSGGGLSLSHAQHGYDVVINVQRSTFENNMAAIGGASSVIWYAGSFESHITFSDCNFSSNGLPRQGAGGVAFFKDIIAPPSARFQAPAHSNSNTMTFLRSNFTQNAGSVGSGLYVQSLYSRLSNSTDQLTLDSCRFEANSALAGAAVYVVERKGHGTQEGLEVIVQGCTFVDNIVAHAQGNTPSDSDSVFQVLAINVTIKDSSFLSNAGTAIGGTSSLIILKGCVEFYNNNAITGGALHLAAVTLLLVKNNSLIRFTNNSATISGGAIYTDYGFAQSDINSYIDCFLYWESLNIICTPDFPCPNLTLINISVVFMYNKGPLGAILYGSTLDICPWAIQLKQLLNAAEQNIFKVMYERSIIFKLDQRPSTPAVFSTPASTLDVRNNSTLSKYMPGQQFTLAIHGIDRLNQSIQTVVTSQRLDNFIPQLGDSGYWLTSTSNDLMAATKVYGQRNVTMNITLYSLDTFIQSAPVSITLTECLFGFVYTEAGGGNCQCSNATISSTVTCDEDLKVFNITYGWWIGPEGPGGAGLVYKQCLLDYCAVQAEYVKSVTVQPQALNDQCANHRTGLLCGRCQDGYSAVFGTNRCMKCTNSPLGLLVFFAAAGIGIIAIISFLRITVADGYINGILFYVSIVSSYEVYFTGHLEGREVFIPIFLLNLDMGFETCFYNGMTPLDRVGLSLVFPIYLFILMVLFIWLASHSFKVSQWLANNSFTPSKLLATLITLSYNSITQSCFQILGFIEVTVYQEDGSSSVIRPWSNDPNVEYFSPLHAVLFVISVVLMIVFVIPVPILLILPSFTSCGLLRLKPLYDAFVSPLKDRFAFWIGLRFVLRIIYFIIASFSEPPLNLLLLGVGLVLAIFLTATVQPYKSATQNTLDDFFQCNILLLAVGALYFQALPNTTEANRAELAFALVVVGVAYAVTLGVFGSLIFLRFPQLSKKFRVLCKKRRSEPSTPKAYLNPATTQSGDTEEEPQTQKHSLDVEETVNVRPIFSELREPLLDSVGYLELH